MCYHTKQTADAQTLKNRFKADIDEKYQASEHNHGYTHPLSSIILNTNTDKIILSSWGLMPNWKHDRAHQRFTLNATIENLKTTPSYRDYVSQRCLILVNGFFEWQWLDNAGKKKQQYLIEHIDHESFAIAGIYNNWIDRNTGEVLITHSMITTKANKFMAEIHNQGERMPMILNQQEEGKYLLGEEIDRYRDVKLVATKTQNFIS